MIYFIDFINTCISIEKKNTTTEKINDLILLSMNCNTEDEIILCSIFTNQFINKNIKIGKKIIFSIIEIIFNINRETLFLLFKQFGDIEKLYLYLSKNNTKNLVDNIYSNCNQIKNISIKTIKNLIDNLSKIKGINSEFNKINQLVSFMLNIKDIEAAYLLKILLNQLKIGVGIKIIKQFLSIKHSINIETIENIFSKINNIDIIISTIENYHKESHYIQQKNLLFQPIKYMLASIPPLNIEDILMKKNTWRVEQKFDGIRIQIHKQNNIIKIYSRNMNDITSRFNTIIMEIINSINENSIILDAEAIAISNIGKSLPFQNILQKPKLYCENNIKYNHDIKINIFDILYLNNNCLLDVKLDDRKKILDNCNIKNSKYIEICKSLKIDSINLVKSINKLLSISINCGHEGLVIKDSNSKYISGRKGKLWIKKKQLMDTLDLVITGGVWGVGKRKNKIGSYILSCYHKKTNNFTEVCNVGTGLNDNMLEYLTNELLKIVISEKETTIKVIPKIIVEVGFEEIQKRNNSCEENYSLRFPRVIKIRNDKNIEDIDTLEKIEYMYLNQK